MSVRGGVDEPPPIELSNQVLPGGEAVVFLGGELDIVSAELAYRYVSDVIDRVVDRSGGQVLVNLNALHYCDAHGLRTLVQMCDYAEQVNCVFRLVSPSPSVVKMLRLTGLDRRFPLCLEPCTADT